MEVIQLKKGFFDIQLTSKVNFIQHNKRVLSSGSILNYFSFKYVTFYRVKALTSHKNDLCFTYIVCKLTT